MCGSFTVGIRMACNGRMYDIRSVVLCPVYLPIDWRPSSTYLVGQCDEKASIESRSPRNGRRRRHQRIVIAHGKYNSHTLAKLRVGIGRHAFLPYECNRASAPVLIPQNMVAMVMNVLRLRERSAFCWIFCHLVPSLASPRA